MADEWLRLSLRDANVVLIDCEHRTPDSVEEGYPYITIPQLKNGHIDFSSARRISQADFVQWTRKAKPVAHDVVLSRRTNPGVTAYVPDGAEFALGQNLVLLRADGTKVFPPFLRWLVRGPEWWQQIARFLNVGAVFDSLRCADVPNFELSIPPLSKQMAIANLLAALDDKVEVSRQMAETLEDMAQALFKSWFIDFDPIHANAQGRTTSLSDNLCALFPINFGEHGEPAGWREGPIGDAFDLLGGGTPKTSVSEYWNGEIPWFSVVDAPEDFVPFAISTERSITSLGLENCASRLIPVGATIITARGTVGKLAIVGTPMAMNQSCYAAIPRNGYTNYFVYFVLRNAIENLKARSHGSVFSTITRQTFDSVRTYLPPPEVAMHYEQLIEPLMSQIKALAFQAQILAEVRDMLLPKLISGELPIAAAEKQIAVA
jgi:type I restriction enzyme, S subunit